MGAKKRSRASAASSRPRKHTQSIKSTHHTHSYLPDTKIPPRNSASSGYYTSSGYRTGDSRTTKEFDSRDEETDPSAHFLYRNDSHSKALTKYREYRRRVPDSDGKYITSYTRNSSAVKVVNHIHKIQSANLVQRSSAYYEEAKAKKKRRGKNKQSSNGSVPVSNT